MSAWLVREAPGAIDPKFSVGQSVCAGCGSDDISCATLSLFVTVTVPPTATSALLALAPALLSVIVIVAGAGPLVGGGVGAVGESEPPPHATAIKPRDNAPPAMAGSTQRLIVN